jgi:putative transposase
VRTTPGATILALGGTGGHGVTESLAGRPHVLAAEAVRVIRTPLQAPVANCYAERWVGSVRRECLDWLIILGRRHLERVLSEFIDHYNCARPHRGLQLQPPNEDAVNPARREGSIVALGWAG